MYKQVDKMVPVGQIFQKELIDKKVCTEDEIQAMKEKINDHLEDAYTKSKKLEYKAEDWVTPEWE